MKIALYFIGKNKEPLLKAEIDKFQKRLSSYCTMQIEEIPDVKNAKNLKPEQLKRAEEEKFLQHFKPNDMVFLLDEKGKTFNSRSFASWMEKQMSLSSGRLVLCIGGAFGFSESLKQKANGLISLSSLTLTHQMARIVLVEQIYRAFTILNKHPYHND